MAKTIKELPVYAAYDHLMVAYQSSQKQIDDLRTRLIDDHKDWETDVHRLTMSIDKVNIENKKLRDVLRQISKVDSNIHEGITNGDALDKCCYLALKSLDDIKEGY
jgi:phosphomevalonate kinase